MDQARTLLELQDHDLRITRLNKQLDELPVKRAILGVRAKVVEFKTLEKRTEGAARAIDVRVRHLEDEVAALRTKMEREQKKLLSGEVTNPKELNAIAMEMDSLRRRADALEGQELAEMAKREQASGQTAKVRAAIDAAHVREAELVEEFKRDGGGILAELEKLTGQREKLAASLPAELAETYASLRSAKHGIAVGRLEGDACSVCQVNIPAHRLEGLVSGPDVGTCPLCQRLLVVRSEK
jgi:predicted  nucleic acid-binding Zn-ribbon protein